MLVAGKETSTGHWQPQDIMNRHDLMLRWRSLAHRQRVARDLADGAAQVNEQSRDARGIGLLETVWQDLRYAVRGWRRSPALVLTVVATIALGLGLDTALFTIFNATYFRPIG